MDKKIIIMNDLKNILMHVTADIFIFGVTFKLIHTKSITIIASEYTTMKCSYKV